MAMPEGTDAEAMARQLLGNRGYYQTVPTRLTVELSLSTPSEVAGRIRHVNVPVGSSTDHGNVVFGDEPYRLTIDLTADNRVGHSLKVYDTGDVQNEKLGNATAITTERFTNDTD